MPKACINSENQCWKIEGYDGTKQLFTKELPLGSLSEGQMISLLQRLVSKHLNEDEIVAASLRRNSKIKASHLEPHVDSRAKGRYTITVGQNPFYVARRVSQSD